MDEEPPGMGDAAPPWREEERSALRERRAKAGVEPEAPSVGLAISGGGVRSATFGLGLLRGMARAGVLPRIDYLCTVSGGGFVGAMFGRLVSQIGIARAQALLARPESRPLDWLRRNGRYLMPAGARDLGIAIVTYLRAMIAIHGESLLTGLVFAVLVMTPHLIQQSSQRFEAAHWEAWQTLWWPLALAVWLAVAPGLMAGYWVARDATDPNLHRPRPPRRDLVFLVLFALGLVAATAIASFNVKRMPLASGQGGPLLALGALLVGWSCLVGLALTPLRLALADEPHALAVARRRNALTRYLRRISLAALLLALLGLLDVFSWWVLEGLEAGEVSVWGGVGLGGLIVLALRAFAQPLQQFVAKAESGATREWGSRLLHVAGVLGLLILLTAWLVAAQWLVFTPEPLLALRDLSPGVRALGLLLIGLVWVALTAGNDQMANASSLHSFYRARLTRAYLAVGNPLRGLARADEVPPAGAGESDVTKVLASDDLDMRDYRPETEGGPIHLVNACLNQTRDDASELYNADRKGTLVTVSSRGLEIGTRLTMPMPPKIEGVDLGAEVGTLGRWIAISGAAAAPGSGSYTSPGWALLLFFLGVRLGYWMRAPCAPAGGWPPRVARMWRWLVKPAMLMSEASATFFGCARPWWYLSDGGHFDNTGVYALLKRRVDFIVLADDGADPDYDFADLENLVRKARIDLGAEIEFYTREEGARLFAQPTDAITILSPEDMADNHSSRGVMLARVRYPEDALGRREESTLLVVKPNLHDALDLDVLAYAERHPSFPHESTSDQSFDEAQWESYQRLGEDFGSALRLGWLAQLPGWTARRVHPLTISARLHSQPAPAAAAPEPEPLWRRPSARATAIGTTVGLGASGTLLLALWQLGDSLKQSADADRAEARRLFAEASKGVEDLDRACPRLAAHVGPQLLTLRNLAEGERLPQLEREGVALLIERVQAECHSVAAAAPLPSDAASEPGAGCTRPLNLTSLCVQLDKPISSSPLNYWHPAQDARITLATLWRRAFGGETAPSVAAPAPVGAAPSAAPARADLLASCAAGDAPLRLYVQIYDEASRGTAESVARGLQRAGGTTLQVAPVENVTRSSDLRQQRRPVPWPQPTLLVHHPEDLACARALSTALQGLLPAFGTGDDSVWIREAPKSLPVHRGVMDLWLPPAETSVRGGW